jgi:Pyruvate/2-oxoglutarate dehydrogenase complex, dehydrogenase (E1) component, eukaryotic type, beta subunit
VIFGEDVGPLGGVFRVTDGLSREFGETRIWDSPLAEAGIVGTAIGMAMYGMRPVVELQFDAFSYPAFEQITSHLAKMRNRTKGHVTLPIVIRIPYAGGIGGVEHHSDSSEAYWTHTPRAHGGHPVPSRRRLLDAARGDLERRPGHLPRAEEPLLGEGCARAAGAHRADDPRAGAARRAATSR